MSTRHDGFHPTDRAPTFSSSGCMQSTALSCSHPAMPTCGHIRRNADHIHFATIGYRNFEGRNLLSSFRHAPEYLFYSSRRSLT